MASHVGAALALSAGLFAWTLALLLLATRRSSSAARVLSLVLATEGALQVAAVLPGLAESSGVVGLPRAFDVLFLTALAAIAPAYLLLLRELPTPLARPWQAPAQARTLRTAYGATLALASIGALALPAVVFAVGVLGVLTSSLYALACAFDARRRTSAGSPMRERANGFLLAFGVRDVVLLLGALAGLLDRGEVALVLTAASTLLYVPLLGTAIARTDLFLLAATPRTETTRLPARFRDARPLGSGGTWLAHDAGTGGRVVLKRVPSADAAPCRAARTGDARLAQLACVEPADEGAWAAFAYIEGETLRETLRRGRFPEPRARALADDLCAALAALDRHGLVHGDVTPANVVLGADGRATLVDLASARTIDDATHTPGTPRYLAPERARGIAADARADQYAAALCVWESLAGVPYLEGAGDAMDLRVRAAYPGRYRSAPRASPALDAWLRRALAEEPTERFPSTSAAREALQRS